jgi:hypothetical protein
MFDDVGDVKDVMILVPPGTRSLDHIPVVRGPQVRQDQHYMCSQRALPVSHNLLEQIDHDYLTDNSSSVMLT